MIALLILSGCKQHDAVELYTKEDTPTIRPLHIFCYDIGFMPGTNQSMKIIVDYGNRTINYTFEEFCDTLLSPTLILENDMKSKDEIFPYSFYDTEDSKPLVIDEDDEELNELEKTKEETQ